LLICFNDYNIIDPSIEVILNLNEMLMELGFIGRNRLFSLYLYREMSLFGGSNLGCFGGGQKGLKKGVRGDTSLWAKLHFLIHGSAYFLGPIRGGGGGFFFYFGV